jgi:hypothetical protein
MTKTLPSPTSRGIPQALKGTVDEKHGGKVPDAPQDRTEGTDTAHWIPAMCPRQTDSFRETVYDSTGEISYNGHR